MSPTSPTAPAFDSRHLDFPDGGAGDSVAAGIMFVRRALAEWRLGAGPVGREADWAIDVVLVVAELLANAERHGGRARSLDVARHGGRLRLVVTDRSPLPPRQARPHDPARPGGHGLHIIDRVSAAWGWAPLGPGKSVWAELPTPLPSARPEP
ncbi:ATP-binding protein [Streptacidiphilus rugosus]|uniref:ATP-binding protein n=1 Tax=Streptacidiphilus rugosus TaxID=405783 RepID=UPI00068D46B5|nr:ATP-binding protein [Streptacidiphilus rugosus]